MHLHFLRLAQQVFGVFALGDFCKDYFMRMLKFGGPGRDALLQRFVEPTQSLLCHLAGRYIGRNANEGSVALPVRHQACMNFRPVLAAIAPNDAILDRVVDPGLDAGLLASSMFWRSSGWIAETKSS